MNIGDIKGLRVERKFTLGFPLGHSITSPKKEKRDKYLTDIGYNQALSSITEQEVEVDVGEIAKICYHSLGGAVRGDWEGESPLIRKEFRGYGEAIASNLGRVLKVKEGK